MTVAASSLNNMQLVYIEKPTESQKRYIEQMDDIILKAHSDGEGEAFHTLPLRMQCNEVITLLQYYKAHGYNCRLGFVLEFICIVVSWEEA